MRQNLIILSLLFLLTLSATQAQEKPLEIVASTTIIADIAKNVGSEFVNITTLVPPDTDAHAFEPLPSDLRSLESADLILINGAGLEAFLGHVFEELEQEKIVTVSEGLSVLGFGDEDSEHIGVLGEDINCHEEEEEDGHDDEEHEEDEHAHGECDPHFWLDPINVVQMTKNIATAFAELDPIHAETYENNAEIYVEQLEALDSEIRDLLDSIPPEERKLVTNHEFLAYFAQAYDFEIVASVIPGVSTIAEPSPRELATLIETIEEYQISAIFIEVSETGRLAQVVAEETSNRVQIISLYSASLSGEGDLADTYLDYMRFNAQAIFDGLTNS